MEICTATAVWLHGGKPIVPIRRVLVRDPQQRFAPRALPCTDLYRGPEQILRWMVQRWQLEVTFHKMRSHVGAETQRQWSDFAVARTTPCLVALFSRVTLLAAQLRRAARKSAASIAWYRKPRPSFGDTIANVRRHTWRAQVLLTSRRGRRVAKPQLELQRAPATATVQAASSPNSS